ncbi:peptidase [Vibrio albus]|uniref:Peptidase n=1 Tax=Vibrio albus TaxID=2200953 RepID=A0A2U3BF29_9VIBR|nr:type II toxin-antitoxin system RelE/ParE family toxin [Vibrio albus]PWI35370.1 peptidase [Vibrio albus]
MIRSFIHKGLEKFFLTGSTSGIQKKHEKRLRLILTNLSQAESPNDMDLPGLLLHRLKGNRQDIYSVKVNGNWRITFRFINRDVEVVNYEDYH